MRCILTILFVGLLLSGLTAQDNGVVLHQCEPELPQEEREIFKVVEEHPIFPPCDTIDTYQEKKKCSQELIIEYVSNHIYIPSEVKERKIRGIVVVSFVVQKDGCLSDIKIVKDEGLGIAEALQELVYNLPKWSPGRNRGKIVEVLFNLPYSFDFR